MTVGAASMVLAFVTRASEEKTAERSSARGTAWVKAFAWRAGVFAMLATQARTVPRSPARTTATEEAAVSTVFAFVTVVTKVRTAEFSLA